MTRQPPTAPLPSRLRNKPEDLPSTKQQARPARGHAFFCLFSCLATRPFLLFWLPLPFQFCLWQASPPPSSKRSKPEDKCISVYCFAGSMPPFVFLLFSPLSFFIPLVVGLTSSQVPRKEGIFRFSLGFTIFVSVCFAFYFVFHLSQALPALTEQYLESP